MATASARSSAAAVGQPENVAQLLRRLGKDPGVSGSTQATPRHGHREGPGPQQREQVQDGHLRAGRRDSGGESDGMERVRDRRLDRRTLLSAFVRPRKLGKVLGADGMQRHGSGSRSAFRTFRSSRAAGSRGPSTGRRRSRPSPATWWSRSSARATPRPRSPASSPSTSPPAAGWPGSSSPSLKPSACTRRPDDFVVLGLDDWLDGGNVLPGFRLAVRELFESERITLHT